MAINEARLIKKFSCVHCRDPLNMPLALDCGHLVCGLCFWSCPKCPKCDSSVLHRPESCTLLDSLMDVLFLGRYNQQGHFILELAEITTDDIRKELLDLLICNICKKLVIDPVIPNCGHEERAPWWSPITLIHRYTRCEYCKVHPITGDSYRCVTCEKVSGMNGFAYCSRCFENFPFQPRCSMLKKSGDHKFELVPPVKLRGKILKKAAEYIENNAAEEKPVVFVESWEKYTSTSEGAEDEDGMTNVYPWK